MKFTRVLIVLLVLILICINVYGFAGIKETPLAMDPANLTVVEAPDQTEAMEHPDFIKEEYIPVIPEGTNIALEGKAEASSFTQSYVARKAIDGNAKGVSYWEAAPDSYPNTLTVDLKRVAPIHAVRILLNPASIWGKRTQTFAVKVSTDGENFTELVPLKDYVFDPDRGNEAVITFDPVDAQYVQLEFTANTGAAGGQVAEFEIYSKE